ncbi:class I adenylate-forming enzyme family protein [Nocardioides dongkuii]|uniref:class I adenylate-forming enzyme family protein n=1 Tax=Nocardioides dongkuii TaxID=2760089 RepID=UPI0015FB8823|nr:class I adenylate-forming enzyme family protein [Nocardioides dongkuii]
MSTNTLTPRTTFPQGAAPEPGSPHEEYVAERLTEVGTWGTDSLSDHVRRHAVERPDRIAYVEGDLRTTWREFDAMADHYARVLVSAGVAVDDRVAVLFPDGPTVHALYVGVERAGAIIVGIGPRAGLMEVRHLLQVSGATTLVTAADLHGKDMVEMAATLVSEGLELARHVVVQPHAPFDVLVDGTPVATDGPGLAEVSPARQRGIGELFMLNSTSGTTGMPKCVTHNQNRWFYYHEQVLAAGEFSADDVFLALIPAPFGFGLWTSHFTPIILGATTVVMSRFNADEAMRLVEREGATVLTCVSTQFIMMLNSEAMGQADTSSLRCMFTGGEAIPFDRAARFEDSAGATVLNFYGSNETGTLSYTTFDDSRELRLTTGGRVVGEMQVRLFDEHGADVTATGGPGQAACRGPATSWGYYADRGANESLFTADGWMLTGDICTIDADGYLRVVDRKADFIIRGGKNISAAAVEEQVGRHPAVSMVAAVPVADEVFGERVCAVIVLRAGHELDLADLQRVLAANDVSKELWPERLVFVDELPRASGGKVAKSVLKKSLRG